MLYYYSIGGAVVLEVAVDLISEGWGTYSLLW